MMANNVNYQKKATCVVAVNKKNYITLFCKSVHVKSNETGVTFPQYTKINTFEIVLTFRNAIIMRSDWPASGHMMLK